MEALKPNEVGGIHDPVNLTILDVDEEIRQERIKQVTSVLIYEPSTQFFHPEGLFSEEIFGKVGSPDRMRKFGFIHLNTLILAPKIFRLVCQLGALYNEIMAGKTYAIWDPTLKDFIRVHGDPSEENDADTGFSFFMKHFKEINFKTTDSSLRDERIDVVKQYQSVAVYDNYLVYPAGLRDIRNDTSTGRIVQDDVNKLFMGLIMYTRSIPKGSTSDIYDTVRYQIQSKGLEIYEYLENMLNGKRGFIQGSFARRKVAMGTRNVISAATMISPTPSSPQMLKADEVMVGTFQSLKSVQPLAVFYLNAVFVNPIFGSNHGDQVGLVNIDTKSLEYAAIEEKDRWRFTTSAGVETLINRFENHDLRADPVMLNCEDGTARALCMVYDGFDEVGLCRSLTDLKTSWPYQVDPSLLRPITWIEMFYVIAVLANMGKHATITRYPVINGVGDVPAIPHVASTTPGRQVKFRDMMNPEAPPLILPEYPVVGKPYFDIMAVHPSRLGGFGGDSICVVDLSPDEKV